MQFLSAIRTDWQVMIAMLVWNGLQPDQGWMRGLIAAAIFMVPTVALYRARNQFTTTATTTGTQAE